MIDVSDNARCEGCGKAINLDATPPCPHGARACDMCEPEVVCEECRRRAELEALDALGGEVPC